MNVTSRRIVVALGLALAAVAISVPVAQGARPDDRAVHGVGAITTPTAVPEAIERAVRIHTDSLTVADAFERAALRAQPTQAVRPDDRTGVRGPGIVASSPILSASTGLGFAWGYAALGAGAMLVLCCLLAAGGLAATRQHRKVALR